MKRRLFLKGAGGALLAAPLLTSLRREAHADASAPRRSVIFHSPCGCLTDRWFPRVEHGPLDADALAGTTLEVLTPFVDKLLFPRGLRAMNQFGYPQFVDPHDQAMGSKLTCALLDASDSRHYPVSHSLDHEIARQINPNGAAPLVLSVGVSGTAKTNVKLLLSYSAAGTAFPAVTSPRAVYDELSGVFVGSDEYGPRRRQSILDAVKDDLETYRRLDMSRADQARVNAWMELVRETEIGIGAVSCDPSAVGVDAARIDAAGEGGIPEAFTLGADMMIRLMALNLLCDTNRSLVLTFPGYVKFEWDGIRHDYDHDGLAHRTGSSNVGGACLEGVLGMLAEIDAWYAAKYLSLVRLLASLPEGDVSLLDNTATMWIQEVSDGGAMNLNNMPIVIAGSAGGYLKQGAAVRLELDEIGTGNSEGGCGEGGDGIASGTGSMRGNAPINKLYVTLMNAVGCRSPEGGEVESFGQFDGTIAEEGITDPGEFSALKA